VGLGSSGRLVDAVIEITDDELAAAIALRKAIYRIVFARLEGRRPNVADVDLLNEHASQRGRVHPLRPAAPSKRCQADHG
jgi:hypothetical protein